MSSVKKALLPWHPMAALGMASVAMSIVLGSVKSAQAATFRADLSGAQVVPATSSTATGTATFELNDAGTELRYTLELNGVTLKPNPGDRTAANDVDKIHLHVAPSGGNGPHVLNIFGLPAEDDDDLTVDYSRNRLSGIWDDSDASDLNSNGVADSNDSKRLSDFIDALNNGDLYLQVHTAGFAGGELRGQLAEVPPVQTPEPLSLLGLGAVSALAGMTLRRTRL